MLSQSCDIFDFYRASEVLHEDDYADFLVIVQDSFRLEDGLMAVSGLTLSLLEGQWSDDRFMLLLKAYWLGLDNMVRERMLVGLILILMKYNTIIREKVDIWEPIQEILSDDYELSFTALCNIARTAQIKHLEHFNQQMAKDIMPLMNQLGSDEFYDVIRKHQGEMERIARLHLDQNFLIFKTAYQSPFFQERAAHWLKPWDKDQLLNVDEEERDALQGMMDVWPLCDSDKYALMGMSKMLRDTLRGQLQADMLQHMGEALGDTAHIITNGYVQQLYRYFRLSSFSRGALFDLIPYLRDTWVYRILVVGENAKQTISDLIQ